MQQVVDILLVLISFGIVALAAGHAGTFCARFRLPRITGFLLTGMLAGPFLLDMISREAVSELTFLNRIALAVIAFAAGSELFLEEVRPRLRSIARVTAGLVFMTFVFGGLAFWLIAGDTILGPQVSPTERLAIACIVGSILVARSPSSAIAIVRELRAKGPFTQMALGVTVIMDAVVIVLFSICSEVSEAVTNGLHLDLLFIVLLVVELASSVAIGFLVWKVLVFILAARTGQTAKTIVILLLGWGVFHFAEEFRRFTHENWPFEIFVEPLLICMIGGLLVTNRSACRAEFARILDDMGPPVYTAFFVLTGAALDLEVLGRTWGIALILFVVRMVTVFIGSFSGSVLSGDPRRHALVGWMAFITQAGVGIGLAREVAVEFPEWGESVATVIIAVIVINQLVGPPLFKWAVGLVKESRVRADGQGFDGIRDALIFGSGGAQSLTLARQLKAHGCQARVAIRDSGSAGSMSTSDVEVIEISDLSLETLRGLDATHADAVVALLSDAENLELCELVYENFGIDTVVVRLHDRAHLERFRELGVLIVDPSTAMVSLLEHFVRSPTATSLLLGTEPGQDVIEVAVRDPQLDGVLLRNLNLPLDTLVISISRDEHALVSHGHTRIRLGDRVTVVGPPDELDEVTLRFDP